MQANFDYIEEKDRIYEIAMMNAEDKNENQIDCLDFINKFRCLKTDPFKKARTMMIKMSQGKYKFIDENKYIGLGILNQGIREPIVLKSQHPSSKNGIGFIYSRYKYYPNRRREFIKWVKG
jgi:hypothetical protein